MSDMTPTIEPLLVPLPEACRALGVARSTLYRLLARGDLTARKIGDLTQIETASIHALIERLPRPQIRVYRRRPAPDRTARPAA